VATSSVLDELQE
jgi:hypothetical protein